MKKVGQDQSARRHPGAGRCGARVGHERGRACRAHRAHGASPWLTGIWLPAQGLVSGMWHPGTRVAPDSLYWPMGTNMSLTLSAMAPAGAWGGIFDHFPSSTLPAIITVEWLSTSSVYCPNRVTMASMFRLEPVR